MDGTTSELRVPTRMGDGSIARLTRSELRADIEDGVAQAVRRAKVPPLTQDEQGHLLDIYASPARVVGVDLGDEIVLSCDGTGMKTHATRTQDMQSYEQWMGADLLELCPGRLLAQGHPHDPALRGAAPARRPAVHHRPDAVRHHAQPGSVRKGRRPL